MQCAHKHIIVQYDERGEGHVWCDCIQAAGSKPPRTGNGIDQANGYETERHKAERETKRTDTRRRRGTPAPLEVPAKVTKTRRNAPILLL